MSSHLSAGVPQVHTPKSYYSEGGGLRKYWRGLLDSWDIYSFKLDDCFNVIMEEYMAQSHCVVVVFCYMKLGLEDYCIKAYFARDILRKPDLQAAWFSFLAWRHRADERLVSFGFTWVTTSDLWCEAKWIGATFFLLKLTRILFWDLFKTRKMEVSTQTFLSLFMCKWWVEPWSRWSQGKNVSGKRCYCV